MIAKRPERSPAETTLDLAAQRAALQIARVKLSRETVGLKTDLVKLRRAREGLQFDRVRRLALTVVIAIAVLGLLFKIIIVLIK